MLSTLFRIKIFSKNDGVFDFVNPLLLAANVEALALVAVIEFLRAGTNAD